MRLVDELIALEESMIARGWGTDRESVEPLLAPDFIEFGSSGRMWTRATILGEMQRTPGHDFVLSGATCYPMSDTSALLTYRLTYNGRRSLRSSLWVRRDGNWQVLFHQGTTAAVQD